MRVRASAATARGGDIYPVRWRGSAGWPATATSGAPPSGSPHRNNGKEGAQDEKAAHSPSTDKAAAGHRMPGLALNKKMDILELGPREVSLPKVKPRYDETTSPRGAFMRGCFLTPNPSHPAYRHPP